MEMILELIKNDCYLEARRLIIEENAVDIAQFFEQIPSDKLVRVFRMLPKDIAAEVFAHAAQEIQLLIVSAITDTELSGIIADLFLDDTVDFLEEMPANVVKKVLRNTDERTRTMINQLLSYPEHSAGSIMTIEFIDLKKEMNVDQAISRIRSQGVDAETIDTCYVTDANRKLEGVVSIRKLILSSAESKIADIMDTNIIYINTHDRREDIALTFRKYDLTTMPVTDHEQRLVGIITIDDIIDIIVQENTEDFHKMAGVLPEEEAYIKTPVLRLAKNRILWLLILMISASFTGAIISKYESALSAATVLVTFMPMLMSTGGNAGSQSSALVIRSMALSEIQLSDILKVMWKELRVSLLTGAVLATVNAARIVIFEYFGLLAHMTPLMIFIVSISLMCTVMVAKLVGCSLPILAKAVGLDPAIMAAPIISTTVDAIALTIYFSLATTLLHF